jgi:hypothetical protein
MQSTIHGTLLYCAVRRCIHLTLHQQCCRNLGRPTRPSEGLSQRSHVAMCVLHFLFQDRVLLVTVTLSFGTLYNALPFRWAGTQHHSHSSQFFSTLPFWLGTVLLLTACAGPACAAIWTAHLLLVGASEADDVVPPSLFLCTVGLFPSCSFPLSTPTLSYGAKLVTPSPPCECAQAIAPPDAGVAPSYRS